MIRSSAVSSTIRQRLVAVAVVSAGICLVRFGDIALGSIWLWIGIAVFGLFAPPIYLFTNAARRRLLKPFRRTLLIISCLNLFPALLALQATRFLREQHFGLFDDYAYAIVGWGIISLVVSADIIAIGYCFAPKNG